MNCEKNKDQNFADSVVKLMNEHYENLPKSGKPTSDEWTVAAVIVEEDSTSLRVVASGTGSKCVGRKSLSPLGDILNDAHAEVVARRGFLLYLMGEIQTWYQTGSSRIFCRVHGCGLVLKETIRYYFVSSAPPCGDGAIILMTESAKKRKCSPLGDHDTVVSETPDAAKKPCLAWDIHRTGAKCLPTSETQDSKRTGVEYHITGQVRTKPGRGDPTASVSCSDKLARWNGVGLQGAMIALLLAQPIHFKCIVIAEGVPFSESALERAINIRIGQPGKIHFLQSQISFPASRSDKRTRPAPCSIAWSLPNNQAQVSAEGRRLGATKTKACRNALDISKKHLHERFLQVLYLVSPLPSEIINCDFKNMTYRELKDSSRTYQSTWKALRDNHFKIWTKKPLGLEDFMSKSK